MSNTNFLDDFVDLEPFAADAGRHPRTVRRWLNQPDGLPYTRIGNRILIHIRHGKAFGEEERALVFYRLAPLVSPTRKLERTIHTVGVEESDGR